jgi:hypothetical protein
MRPPAGRVGRGPGWSPGPELVGSRGEETSFDLKGETGSRRDFFSSLLEYVAQKWAPVLRYSDMRNQKVRVGRVNANERDPL